MTPTSLVAVVAPRTGKINKKWPQCFRKKRIFATKWYATLCI